jgi:hypothetical protein
MAHATGEAKESPSRVVHENQDVDVQFHLKEFELLKDEIKRRSDEQMISERLTAIACAAVYSFTVTIWNQDVDPFLLPGFLLLWWIPPVIIFYSSVRWNLNAWMIDHIGSYIKDRLEPLLAANGEGWEVANATYRTAYKDAAEAQPETGENKSNSVFRRRGIFESALGRWGTLEKVRLYMLLGATLLALIQTILALIQVILA